MNIINNYHTHTIYCNHASNTAEEMIMKAIGVGIKKLGFSEHAPLNSFRKYRLNFENLDKYINEILILKEKYKNKIEIYIGFECEYDPSQYQYYYNLRNKTGVDYLILGNHNKGNPHDCIEWRKANFNAKEYFTEISEAIKSKLFSCVAHPDWFLRWTQSWGEQEIKYAHEMFSIAEAYNMPLGFNLNGLKLKNSIYDYPSTLFWKEASKTNVSIIIEADAHEDSTFDKEWIDKAEKLINESNIKKNLIWDIKLI